MKCNFLNWLKGFSLIEIVIAMMVIAVITAAFMPIITKKMKANSLAVKMEGAVKYKCAVKFGENCRLCYKHGCLYCELTCPIHQAKVTKDCKCHKCDELHSNCLDCTEFKCTKCKPGYYLTAANKCEACPTGNWCDGTSTIHPCAVGYYQPNKAQSSCLACNPGTYNSSTGNISCNVCEAGYKCPGASDKQACNSGKYQAYTGKSACDTCPAGKYSAPSGAAKSCTNCPAGTWSNAGSSSCPLSCDAGYACPGDGNKNPCNNGKYQAYTGKAACDTCPAGKFTSPSGANKACANCPAGSWSNVGSSSCPLSCDAGYACPGNGTKNPCNSGKYQAYTGKSACDTCPAGKYSPTSGAIKSCTNCPAGSWSNQGASSCSITCPAGSYCPGTGSKGNCSGNQCSTAGASKCSSCNSSCGTCSNTTCKCATCPAGKILSNGTCVACTGKTYSTGGTATQCSSCSSACSACNNSTGACTGCVSGYYFSNGSCNACSANCETCSASGCSKCKSGYYLTRDGSAKCVPCDGTAQYFMLSGKCLEFTTRNAGDSGGLSIPSGVGICDVSEKCNCGGSRLDKVSKCCWQGNTSGSGSTNNVNGKYNGKNRTLCNKPAAEVICSKHSGDGWRLPYEGELKALASETLAHLSNSTLSLCSAGYKTGKFNQCIYSEKCKGAETKNNSYDIQNQCTPMSVWAANGGTEDFTGHFLYIGSDGPSINSTYVSVAKSVRCVRQLKRSY